jgi:hypothetical protein
MASRYVAKGAGSDRDLVAERGLKEGAERGQVGAQKANCVSRDHAGPGPGLDETCTNQLLLCISDQE